MDRMIEVMSPGDRWRDTFAERLLAPPETWPELDLAGAGLSYPDRLNAAEQLLSVVHPDDGEQRIAFIGEHESWTYGRLNRTVDAIAHVLTRDFGVVPGSRVLLRGPNSPRLAACWLAVIKAGGIVVGTMPLLRCSELVPMLLKTAPLVALCDRRYVDELDPAIAQSQLTTRLLTFDGGCEDGGTPAAGSLEALLHRFPQPFAAADTAADEVALICFTSGTTGTPKAAAHFHRDLLAVADLSPRSILTTGPADVFCGSPSITFAYGLGGLLLFPLRVGGTAVLVERATPDRLLRALLDHGVTIFFAVPTAYRLLTETIRSQNIPCSTFAGLRLCVSAGEPLPTATARAWAAVSGHEILDSLGTTEMLNAVIHATPGAVRTGAVGRAVPGYRLQVVDADMRPLPARQVGRLAVRGPTGCRYLDDPRQTGYVDDGWNLTGDAGWLDEDGYFYHQGRTDDLIVSGGYKVSGIEIEDVLLRHDAVAECAVVAAPDQLRGSVPCAYVVTDDTIDANSALAQELQDFVRDQIAPYKHPRRVIFVDELPRTETGKLQRYRLREMAGRDIC